MTAQTRVLITARAIWEHGKNAEDLLRSHGFEVVRTPIPGPLSEANLLPHIDGFDAVIASSDAYNATVLNAAPRLKVVSRWGVGIDSVDLNTATDLGIVVTNCPGSMTDPVADYTFALMLSISRRIVDGDNLMRSGQWGELGGVLVCGKTLGLVGMGQIGQGVAKRAIGFGMRILAFDPPLAAKGPNALPSDLPPVEFVDLPELLAQSDFVSLHAPNLPETRKMFNADLFQQMKPSAYFINTARGALVDEEALLEALKQGTIAGAGIDVYSKEPLPADHPLRQAPNCVLTPHNAFNAAEAAQATSLQTAHNVLKVLNRDKTAPVCNPAVWDSPNLRL